MEYLLFSLLIGGLSFISGMLGLGVAFILTPVLGLFGFDLKHVIMPWSLFLNGLTATSTAIAFARSRMVDWRTAIPLLIVTTLVAPIGVWILQFVSTVPVWWIYVGVLLFLAYRMAFAPKQDDSKPSASPMKHGSKGASLAQSSASSPAFWGSVRDFSSCQPWSCWDIRLVLRRPPTA